MATRKRKTVYPPARTDTKQPPRATWGDQDPTVRRTVATIDPSATNGRSGLSVGDRVRIQGTGLYAGEAATIEKLTAAVVPAALVRTDAGRTRQVRTIDLVPLGSDAA